MASASSRLPRVARPRIVVPILVAIAVLVVAGAVFTRLYTDLLFYRSVGFTSVFSRVLWTRVFLFFLFGVVMAVAKGANIVIAYRVLPPFRPLSAEQQNLVERYRHAVEPYKIGAPDLRAVVPGISAGPDPLHCLTRVRPRPVAPAAVTPAPRPALPPPTLRPLPERSAQRLLDTSRRDGRRSRRRQPARGLVRLVGGPDCTVRGTAWPRAPGSRWWESRCKMLATIASATTCAPANRRPKGPVVSRSRLRPFAAGSGSGNGTAFPTGPRPDQAPAIVPRRRLPQGHRQQRPTRPGAAPPPCSTPRLGR